MKRILFISVLTILSLSVAAQIQRKFMGQTLGESTKSSVYNELKDKKAYYDKIDGDEVICIKDVRFGGYSWDYAVFKFCDNKLMTVFFWVLGEPDLDNENSNPRWNDIRNRLSSKYDNYVIEDENDSKSYMDDKTYLNISKTDGRLLMGYSDLELAKNQKDADDNEYTAEPTPRVK